MSYWEDFFTLDKMIYPGSASIFMGGIYFVFAYLLNLAFSEPLFYIFIGVGFIIGNTLKIKALEKQRSIEASLLKKKKAKKKTV
jgi:hypothetical protein